VRTRGDDVVATLLNDLVARKGPKKSSEAGGTSSTSRGASSPPSSTADGTWYGPESASDSGCGSDQDALDELRELATSLHQQKKEVGKHKRKPEPTATSSRDNHDLDDDPPGCGGGLESDEGRNLRYSPLQTGAHNLEALASLASSSGAAVTEPEFVSGDRRVLMFASRLLVHRRRPGLARPRCKIELKGKAEFFHTMPTASYYKKCPRPECQ